MLPEIIDPVLVIELDTMTVIWAGTLFGGPELFPGSLRQVPPQLAGFVLGKFAKPLKPEGVAPPLSEFEFAHCEPQ